VITNNEKILTNLISEVFADKLEVTALALKKHKLDVCIIQVLDVINGANVDSLSDSSFISGLSSVFLTNVNTIIGKIKSSEEKERIEYIVNQLTNQILIEVIKKSKSSPQEVLKHIGVGLKMACTMNGWNYEVLRRIMNFDLLHTLSAQNEKAEPTQKLVPAKETKSISYYRWLCEHDDLTNLANYLKDHKAIKSTTEFKKLFKPHKGDIKVRFDMQHRDLVLALFDQLNSKKFIQPTGHKAKKFTPLKAYAVDFEKKQLINSQAKSLKYGIEKNVIKASSLKTHVNNWISDFKTKS
jgi:hypothetical protein